jgi:hypothetical protein
MLKAIRAGKMPAFHGGPSWVTFAPAMTLAAKIDIVDV